MNFQAAYDYIDIASEFKRDFYYLTKTFGEDNVIARGINKLSEALFCAIGFGPEEAEKFLEMINDSDYYEAERFLEWLADANPVAATDPEPAYTYTIYRIYRTSKGPEARILEWFDNEEKAIKAIKDYGTFCYLERTESFENGPTNYAEYDRSAGRWLEGKY